MINDNASWASLIAGLQRATKVGRLKWTEKDNKTHHSLQSMITSTVLGRRGRVFSATRNGAIYELTSADSFGTAPYQLEVWELEGLKQKPLGSLSSTTVAEESRDYPLNVALKDLFSVVDEETESSEQIVSRLLGDL